MSITYEDFKKVEIRAGKILGAERVEGSEKLLKLSVDFGEESPRQILSGILKYFPNPEELVGKTTLFVTNLEPRSMMGLVSDGMLFAMGNGDTAPFTIFTPNEGTPPGTLAS